MCVCVCVVEEDGGVCGEKSEWRSVDIVKSVGEDGGDEEECEDEIGEEVCV